VVSLTTKNGNFVDAKTVRYSGYAKLDIKDDVRFASQCSLFYRLCKTELHSRLMNITEDCSLVYNADNALSTRESLGLQCNV
jgi:hypothetical protein